MDIAGTTRPVFTVTAAPVDPSHTSFAKIRSPRLSGGATGTMKCPVASTDPVPINWAVSDGHGAARPQL